MLIIGKLLQNSENIPSVLSTESLPITEYSVVSVCWNKLLEKIEK